MYLYTLIENKFFSMSKENKYNQNRNIDMYKNFML